MAQAAVLRAHNRANNKGSDPRVATCRGKLQNRRSKLNQEINRELRLRAGAENLFRATTNRKLKETVALELSFVNSNLQLLKEQLAELNSSVEIYQGESLEPVMPMIPLGLKETKEIDFREPFKDFILEHYSEDGTKYDDAITEFMDLRQAMRTPQRDKSGISLLFQYYNQLYFVERRFFPPDRSLGIYFEWYDSLTGVPSCQRTVAFEKACVLFNMAALFTQMGAKEDRSTVKGLDAAMGSFLKAAGCLAYLVENFANAPSMDLAPATLAVLAQLMVSQARETRLERLQLEFGAEKSQPPAQRLQFGLDLAREASQVVEVYEEASHLMSEVADYVPESWSALCSLKAEHYRAVARAATGRALLAAAKVPKERLPQTTAKVLQTLVTQQGDTGLLKPSEQHTAMGLAQLRCAQSHHEEAARLQRMCRELRHKSCLGQVLTRAASATAQLLAESSAKESQLADLLDPPAVPSGESKYQLELTPPDFGSQRVDDLFKGLGPLAVFSAKQHWSAPRLVLLQQTSTSTLHHSDSVSLGYGFTISTDCPVVVTSVQHNSLAHFGGIREGDFIVAIDDRDVKWSTHEDVVRLIKACRDRLSLKIVTPMDSNYIKTNRGTSKNTNKKVQEMTGSSNSKSALSLNSSPSSANGMQHRKLSWNPFKRNRDRETALNLILR